MFRRKIYDKLLKWKNREQGSKAILIEGARRVGKSTVVEGFAKDNYKSYILFDFFQCFCCYERCFQQLIESSGFLIHDSFC